MAFLDVVELRSVGEFARYGGAGQVELRVRRHIPVVSVRIAKIVLKPV
jgi:hypothetical protein